MNVPPLQMDFVTPAGRWLPQDWQVTLERQRPAQVWLTTEEPLDAEAHGLLRWGVQGQREPRLLLRPQHTAEIHKQRYETELIEPTRDWLDGWFSRQLPNSGAATALLAVAAQAGFSLEDRAGLPGTPQGLVLHGTVRNALDQIWLAWKLRDQKLRWHLDLINRKLVVFETQTDGALELPSALWIEENEEGVEFQAVPAMRPHLPVQWRGKTKIVDRVTYSGKAQSMTLKLADA